MIWTNVQRLARVIANQGVQNPGPVDLAGPVQTVQLTDDATWLTSPPPVPMGHLNVAFSSAGAGLHAGLRIQTGNTAGILIAQSVVATAAAADWRIWTGPAPLGTFTTAYIPASDPPPRGSYFSGSIATASIPATAGSVHGQLGMGDQLGVWVWPGSYLYLVVEAANGSAGAGSSVSFREVPA